MSFTKLTNKKKPNLTLTELIKSIGNQAGKALDIGAGPLIESRFLLESGYQVDAIDKDPASAEVASQIQDEKFKFSPVNIVDHNLEKENYDLVISLLALPFVPPADFKNVFKRIIDSLKKGGYLYVSLFSDRDDWATTQTKMTFVTREKIEELFKSFEIIELKEVEKVGPTVKGDIKKWHIFNVVAKKL